MFDKQNYLKMKKILKINYKQLSVALAIVSATFILSCTKDEIEEVENEVAANGISNALNQMASYNVFFKNNSGPLKRHYDSLYHHHDSLYLQHHQNYHHGDPNHHHSTGNHNTTHHNQHDSITVVHQSIPH